MFITAVHLQGSEIKMLAYDFCFLYQDLSSMSPKPDCVIGQNQIKSQNEVTYSRKEKSNVRKAHTLAKIFNMVAVKSFSNFISK